MPSSSMQPAQNFDRSGLLLLFLITLGWGINWPVAKIIVTEIGPLSFRGSCSVIGGLGILALARQGGFPLALPRAFVGRLALLVLFNIVLWNTLCTYGVLYLPSGRAALLGYTMPLWCVPLSVWLLGERITGERILALCLGLGGVVALLSDSVGALLTAPHGILGIALMIAAAWSWALGIVLLKRWPPPVPSIVFTGWMLLAGGIPMTVAALFVDGIPRHWPGTGPLLGLVYNVLVTFMFCYWAWNRLVLRVPVSVSSLSALITPLIGVIAGALMLGERPGWREALAAVLILGAVGVISYGGKKLRKK